MAELDPGFLGTLKDVSGARFIAQIDDDGGAFQPYRQIGVEKVAVGQIGSYVLARGELEQVLRLALGLARSLATSTRFVLDEDFAKSMFLKSRYLLEQLLKHPADQLETFKLPQEVLVD